MRKCSAARLHFNFFWRSKSKQANIIKIKSMERNKSEMKDEKCRIIKES